MGFLKNIFSSKKGKAANADKEQSHVQADIASLGDFPKFKYFLDPLKARAFKKSDEKCDICGQRTGYIYANSFYSITKNLKICPHCIASGAVTQKHKGQFHDFELENGSIDPEKEKELLERTPGFACMQPGIWPCHCDEICTFVDYVGWQDIVRLGLASELEDELKACREELNCQNEDIGNFWENTSAICGYLFRCPSCKKYRLIVDFD